MENFSNKNEDLNDDSEIESAEGENDLLFNFLFAQN